MRLLAAAVAVSMLLGACADDETADVTPDDSTPDDSTPGTAAPDTAAPDTTPDDTEGFVLDDQGTPSPAAVEVDRTFREVRLDFLDCGSLVTTSGWPTTTITPPGATDCIVEAAAAGDPAQYSVTGRDFAGGMEGTVFVVNGPSDIVAITYGVNRDGVLSTANRSCATLMFPAPRSLLPVCGG